MKISAVHFERDSVLRFHSAAPSGRRIRDTVCGIYPVIGGGNVYRAAVHVYFCRFKSLVAVRNGYCAAVYRKRPVGMESVVARIDSNASAGDEYKALFRFLRIVGFYSVPAALNAYRTFAYYYGVVALNTVVFTAYRYGSALNAQVVEAVYTVVFPVYR